MIVLSVKSYPEQPFTLYTVLTCISKHVGYDTHFTVVLFQYTVIQPISVIKPRSHLAEFPPVVCDRDTFSNREQS